MFMISFISPLEVINIVLRGAMSEVQPDLNIFLWIAASVANAAAVNPGINTLLADCLRKFTIGDPVFSNGPKSLPRNPLDCSILCVFLIVSY